MKSDCVFLMLISTITYKKFPLKLSGQFHPFLTHLTQQEKLNMTEKTKLNATQLLEKLKLQPLVLLPVTINPLRIKESDKFKKLNISIEDFATQFIYQNAKPDVIEYDLKKFRIDENNLSFSQRPNDLKLDNILTKHKENIKKFIAQKNKDASLWGDIENNINEYGAIILILRYGDYSYTITFEDEWYTLLHEFAKETNPSQSAS